MSNNPSPGPVTAPFAAIEPNVVVAGVESLAVAAAIAAVYTGRFALPSLGDWHWSYAILIVVALLGLVLLGLAVEGLAGGVEYLMTRNMRGKQKGQLRAWYVRWTNPPTHWGQAQRWMWKSSQASHEFGRRRMRILVARNTWFLIIVLFIGITVGLVGRRDGWPLLVLINLVACTLGFLLFVWVWVSAMSGWHKAVQDAGEIGAP